mgnify:CR=1 FL=1
MELQVTGQKRTHYLLDCRALGSMNMQGINCIGLTL